MTKLESTFTGEPARRYARRARAMTSRSEAYVAVASAAALYVIGATLIATAFLAPLAYSHVSTSFGAFVCVGAVLALLTTSVVHYALGRMREQRWRLEFLIAATANLDSSLDPQQTLRKIARTAVPDLAELCV